MQAVSRNLIRLGFGMAAVGAVASSALYNVDGGQRAVIFDRFTGVKPTVVGEGTHFLIPWVQRPVIFDIRATPRNIVSITGSKDLQNVHITLRILFRPVPEKLPKIYTNIGTDYDERILPSITNEVLKAVVAQFDAAEMITQREVVSQKVNDELTQRASQFGIILDDISLTHLSFGKEFTEAVEMKQVAQQEAERARFVVEKAEQLKMAAVTTAEGDAVAAELLAKAFQTYGDGLIELRRIEASEEIAAQLARQRNITYLPPGQDMLLNIPAQQLSLVAEMSTTAASLTHMKPPNVVLIDAIKAKGNLEKLRLSLNACLDPDQYTIHQFPIEDIFTKPWKTNALGVLLANSEGLNRSHWQEMYKFYRDGGIVVVFFYSGLLESLGSLDACVFFPEDNEARRMLFASMDFASDQQYFKGLNQNGEMFTLSWDAAAPSLTTIFYAADRQRNGIVAFTNFYECTAGEHSIWYLRSLLSKVGFSTRSATYRAPAYTSGRLFIDQDLVNDLGKRYVDIGTLVGNKVRIQFVRNLDDAKPASGSYLPVLVGNSKGSAKESPEQQKTHQAKDTFDRELYFRYLKTSTMGKVVLYVPVMNSTMDVFDGSVCDADLLNRLVAVADVQREGRGRGGNKWISPSGCIAFSFFISRPTSSALVRYCSWLQHISVLSIVDSIRSCEAYAGTPLQLKWPNDVYTLDRIKIGGVLVQSTVSSISCNFIVGCGLNLANEKPTVSLNSIIPKGAPPLQAEQVIALALSSMEKFLRMIEEDRIDELRTLYRKYWLHSGQRVKMADTGESVEVTDLDKHGYLLVRSEETGKMFSLQPDGNSFDMMHNMIRSKMDTVVWFLVCAYTMGEIATTEEPKALSSVQVAEIFYKLGAVLQSLSKTVQEAEFEPACTAPKVLKAGEERALSLNVTVFIQELYGAWARIDESMKMDKIAENIKMALDADQPKTEKPSGSRKRKAQK
ncbi:hypothetical protein M513_02688 [Trichuris suis]|uniref:BPL/LPL catalytic domain-containing protein n=1 Tax=Trichuris suis TaxID=68888 RepID=A0A085MH88_9BILA|nr:hypothetical protein M513_02688 [Trichuris suis]